MASEQDQDYATVATLTRSVEQDEHYSNLSDAYAEKRRQYINLDSFSGSFDDPTALLEEHPVFLEDDSKNDTIGRRPPMPLPNQDKLDSVDTAEGKVQANQILHPDEVLPYSDSDDEDYEDVEMPAVSEQFGRERTESDVIDIIGSLCLEGVYQGLSEEDHDPSKSMLPSSVRMTDNLVKRGEELDELSVMVTRNLEIVPENPFDANSGTGKSLSKLRTKIRSNPVPKLRLRAKSTAPERPHSANLSKVVHRPTSVTYYDNIVRPQPLPPLDDSLSKEEKKRYKVMESLLESEAAFLTSLNIAIEVYKKPLQRKLQENSPVLEQDQIQSLFGPIRLIQNQHELFYAAISEETKDWSPCKQIGGVFLASFSRKDVIKQYCKYVNNFSAAMKTLETNIKKKQRFLDFLKKQLVQSGTQLSLQALLLKPVQRFPQYLLFIQDLIKYTPATHDDSIKLQMAQAQIERVADYLNEAKRSAEQLIIVQHLATKIQKAPFKLTDYNRFLLRQDSIQWVGKKSDGSFKIKRRELLLFDKMLICCSSKKRRRGQGDGTILFFKWSCHISQLEVTEVDYTNENRLSSYISSMSEEDSSEMTTKFKELQTELYQLDYDFQKLCKIQAIVSTLYDQYKGITSQEIHNNIRVLQRKLETVRGRLRKTEPCRVDITIPGRDPTSKARFRHILVFPSDHVKKDWLKAIHFSSLRLSQNNRQTWIMEDEEDEDEQDEDVDSFDESNNFSCSGGGYSMPCSIDNLPLVVDQIKLMGFKNECSSVECAACVGSNRVWLSCSGVESSQIAVIRCLMPTPMLVETFIVDCKKILCMKAISTSRVTVEPSGDSSSSPSSSRPSTSLNVWLGSSCGKLMLYDAINKTCVKIAELSDSVLCIECYKNRAFVGLANGKVFVYTRAKGGEWDLVKNVHHIPVAESPIQCFCQVDKELWIGITGSCVILNVETLRLEHSIKLTSEEGMSVKKLASSSKGVWMALNRGGTLSLYHRDTRQPIQEIDIKGSLASIATCANITDKFSSSSLYISSLLISSGYLWVGTSQGAVLVYRMPFLNGLPMTTGKPILAGDGHTDAVRVLIDVHTTLDLPSARFDQFVTDEKIRKIGSFSNSPKLEPKLVVPTIIEDQDVQQDDAAHKLNCSMKIDQDALPLVSDIIKRLEKSKVMLSPKFPRRIKPAVKSRKFTSSSPAICSEATDTNTAAGTHVNTPPPAARRLGNKQKDSTTTHETSVNEVAATSPSVTPSSPRIDDTPSDYETPIGIRMYDQVPQGDDDDATDGLKATSDPDISLQRYEGESFLSLGDGLYDNLRYRTLSVSMPGQDNSKDNDGHVFILTGGRGLISFRPKLEQISASHIINPQNQDIAASSIAFQIPK